MQTNSCKKVNKSMGILVLTCGQCLVHVSSWLFILGKESRAWPSIISKCTIYHFLTDLGAAKWIYLWIPSLLQILHMWLSHFKLVLLIIFLRSPWNISYYPHFEGKDIQLWRFNFLPKSHSLTGAGFKLSCALFLSETSVFL